MATPDPRTAPPNAPVTAIILAAGQGTRMPSRLHKVLQPIGGRPMLLHLLQALRPLAPAATLVVVGDRAEQVERALQGTGATTVVQSPQLGTGHAVLQAARAMRRESGVALILFGDVPLVETATMERLVAAVTGADAPAIAVLGFRPADPGRYGRIFAGKDGRIERMVEAKDASADELRHGLCNSGLMAVKAALLRPLLEEIGHANAAGEYYLPDIVAVAGTRRLAAIVLEGDAEEVAGVNDRTQLAAAEALFQRRRRSAMLAAGVTLVAPETVFFAADTRLGMDVLVEPNVVFGPGVVVEAGATIRSFSHLEGASVGEGAEVGPYARLRPGAVVGAGARVGNFVEMKQAVLGDGAKANHLTYLGDCEVGAGSNIGAGTITCNYDGFRKSKTIIGAHSFVGSNTALVAPVAVGDGVVIGAGSIVAEDVPENALYLTRARPALYPGWAATFRARHGDNNGGNHGDNHGGRENG